MNFPFRPSVRKMRPYSPGKPIDELARETGHEAIVKLASNENPLGPSPKATQAVAQAAADMHLYPDASGYAVKQALVGHTGLPMEQIVLGNGSDELIAYLGHLFLHSRDDEIIVGDPSFVRYHATAEFADCTMVRVPLTNDLRHDLTAMRSAVSPRTKLVFIANPNNPTGTIVTRLELDRFLADLPLSVLVVLDEAYFEFASGDPTYPNSFDYVRAGKSVIGLRTFSKAYGLAGIRLGYGIGPVEVIDAIERSREPFNVNSLAQAAAIAALADQDHILRTVENNHVGMARVVKVLVELGTRPYPSHANFVYVDIGRPSRPVYEALLRHGVIVRPGDVLGLPEGLRISIGSPSEVDRLIDALGAVLATEAVV
ncbi:MAG: histidinol-phosphate transaminase [Fimbriimonadaceae bacterium]|nr:histidinol-phosphate transaminase [Fimbriimonadaceae bacterium]